LEKRGCIQNMCEKDFIACRTVWAKRLWCLAGHGREAKGFISRARVKAPSSLLQDALEFAVLVHDLSNWSVNCLACVAVPVEV
jgi:hypothetical protein